MATFELQATAGNGGFTPPTAVAPSSTGEQTALGAFRSELDGYYAIMRAFGSMDITDVLTSLASMSARAAEIRGVVVRAESRRAQAFRTKELEPFLEQCDFQFRCWSRYQAVREMEAKLAGGFA